MCVRQEMNAINIDIKSIAGLHLERITCSQKSNRQGDARRCDYDSNTGMAYRHPGSNREAI